MLPPLPHTLQYAEGSDRRVACDVAVAVFQRAKQLPPEHIPTVVIATFALAAASHVLFEAPLRRWLRSK